MIYPADTELESGYVETASGLIVPEWVAEDAQKKRPKGFDLFCGCGGFSLGMIQGGFEIVGACDNDESAAITYLTNLGERPVQFHFVEPSDEARMEKWLHKHMFPKKLADGPRGKKRFISEPMVAGSGYLSHYPDMPGVKNFFFGDVAKLNGKDILRAIGMERGELDCVCGSPPCQGFSNAGKREVLDFRNSLVFEFCRLICELQPKTMVFENVPGIISMNTPEGLPVVDAMCRVLEDGGFGTIEALKKTLAAQAGAVGLLRARGGKVKGKRGGPVNPKPKPKPKQRELAFA